MTKVGIITHYYGKIGVAIVELSGALKVGDRIKIEGNGGEFDQTIESMEVDHKSVAYAGKGEVIGMKVGQRPREGATVHKIEE